MRQRKEREDREWGEGGNEKINEKNQISFSLRRFDINVLAVACKRFSSMFIREY